MHTSFPKILIAPNAFKESLTSVDVAKALAKGLQRQIPFQNIHILPLADGGDGSLEVLTNVLGLKKEFYPSVDPLGREIHAEISYSSENEAFIEMAAATGLHLLQDHEKNAALADSYGTGVLMKEAIERGVKKINLFVGGTASMDCATGILRALGFKFFDGEGKEIRGGGIHLSDIRSVTMPAPEISAKIWTIPVNIFCDVANPLTGKNGSVKVFGSQKDDGKTDLSMLERSFEDFAAFIFRETGKNVNDFPGAGAAGGTPAGLSAFLDVHVFMGAEKILEMCRFDEHLENSDIVITGEGKLDSQTLDGKAPFVVAQKAHQKGKKVIFVGGGVPGNAEDVVNNYFDAILSIAPGPVTLRDSIENAAAWLERTGYLIGKMLTL
jgi:glycerate kinase